jgi:hypothetical protein
VHGEVGERADPVDLIPFPGPCLALEQSSENATFHFLEGEEPFGQMEVIVEDKHTEKTVFIGLHIPV